MAARAIWCKVSRSVAVTCWIGIPGKLMMVPLRLGSSQGERAVADDAASVAGGVAGGAQVEQLDRQAAALGLDEQAAQGERAARPVGLDLAPPPGDDRRPRCARRAAWAVA